MPTGKVLILSGIPGCGKSTWAAKHVRPTPLVVSADHFWMDDGGCYKFEPSRLGEAHAACMHRFLLELQKPSHEIIVVDNTNIHRWERQNYVAAAKLAGWEVEYHFWHANTPSLARLCHSRGVHGVPVTTVALMAMLHNVNDKPAVFHEINEHND